MQADYPDTQDLVLVGGGHTHALVLKTWAKRRLPGTRLTLIDPAPVAAYSGMLPGFIAGHYDLPELEIDLVRLARQAGARLIIGAAHHIDRAAKTVSISGHAPVGYDTLSLDIGITSAMPRLPGFEEFGVPAKPLGRFAKMWRAFCAQPGGTIAVIGGGVAGVELALAMAHASEKHGRRASITIFDAAKPLSALHPSVARQVKSALRLYAIELRDHAAPVAIENGQIVLPNDEVFPADFIVGAAGATPHSWVSSTGLTDENGFLTVGRTLQTEDPDIFAVGDCATLSHAPRPKAGVYAVRQAPFLLHNLKAKIAGTGGLRSYRPQSDYLKLISLGQKKAVGNRFGATVSGPWVWRMKDRIDRAFMQGFTDLPQSKPPALPWPRARGDTQSAKQMLCGGCGAKLGPTALASALTDLVPGIGDDAACIAENGAVRVITIDHLRAFSNDHALVARIAAVHALGDIWAMGAHPKHALATITLPRQADRLAQRALREIMAEARAVFDAEGAQLVGGHTTQGAELSIGFSIEGACDHQPITLSGARPGDALVLVKPIGTGVILAAEHDLRANARDVAHAWARMSQPQGRAARILEAAHAMTDVTGFGLLGHLRNICRASNMGARLELARIPILPGAEALAARRVRSSLYPENRQAFGVPEESPRIDLLYDPQTSGGLLAAVEAPATDVLAALRAAGFDAAQIGTITSNADQIELF